MTSVRVTFKLLKLLAVKPTFTALYNVLDAALAASNTFCLTTVVVLSLTAYTLQSKRDFSSMGAILFCALLLMIFGGLLQVNINLKLLIDLSNLL